LEIRGDLRTRRRRGEGIFTCGNGDDSGHWANRPGTVLSTRADLLPRPFLAPAPIPTRWRTRGAAGCGRAGRQEHCLSTVVKRGYRACLWDRAAAHAQ
jgi:hypothetical protein